MRRRIKLGVSETKIYPNTAKRRGKSKLRPRISKRPSLNLRMSCLFRETNRAESCSRKPILKTLTSSISQPRTRTMRNTSASGKTLKS